MGSGGVEGAINRLLRIPRIDDLVHDYLRGPSETRFAGYLFDDLGENPPHRIVADDLVAVSLLDVRFSAPVVHRLLNTHYLGSELEMMPTTVALHEASDVQLDQLRSAYDKLRNLKGIARTKASKLLARKRPQLAPIADSLVESFFGSKDWSHLDELARTLKSGQIRDRLDAMIEAAPDGTPRTLRALDIAIWMTRSKSKSATQARQRILGSPDRL